MCLLFAFEIIMAFIEDVQIELLRWNKQCTQKLQKYFQTFPAMYPLALYGIIQHCYAVWVTYKPFETELLYIPWSSIALISEAYVNSPLKHLS